MDVTVTCGHCQKQFQFDYIPVTDSPIMGDCTWCGDDICEDCQCKKDADYHDECLEMQQEQEDEEK